METYVIHVTKKCNMKCLYCYEDDKTSSYTWEQIKEFIDNLIKYRTSDVFSIEFLGGEPMLEWDFIQKAYEYIEIEYNKVVNVTGYTITTNGTIFNDHIMRYLKDNKKISIAISLDGTKWANQLRILKENNHNSYDVVVNNIKKLHENDLHVNVHIVTHPFNVAFLEESIEHLYSIGIKDIGIGTIESTMKIDEKYCESVVKKLNNISRKVVEGSLEGLSLDLFSWVKPLEDVRSYIRDKDGKVVGESYGRSGSDISKQDSIYNIDRCENKDDIAMMIYNMRREVYLNHKKNEKLYKKEIENGIIREE